VSRYQKGKTNPDFTEAKDSEWQWHQLGHMQASTPSISFLQAGCPSCHPTNSVKALNGNTTMKKITVHTFMHHGITEMSVTA